MKYSIVVPIFNDGYLAKDFCEEYEKEFINYLGLEHIENSTELIFVNDGSTNNSLDLLVELTTQKKFVKVIDLSRNFGQHIALTCGYQSSKGEYVGMLNVDMQDPPSEIPKLLHFIQNNNYDIVFGISDDRKTSPSNRITSKLFGCLLNFLTKSKIPSNVTTLRVMNRKFVDAYNTFQEKSRYIPGLEAWLGFRHGYLPIINRRREVGNSSYNFKKRLSMAAESIISFSDYPLKLIVGLGCFIALIGFMLTALLIISKLFFINYQPGFTSTVCLITFFGGVQIMVIGFASLYIGRVLREVQNRPLYVINEKYNF